MTLNPKTSYNIDLEITQSLIAPSIFSLRENISKSLIKCNKIKVLKMKTRKQIWMEVQGEVIKDD